MIGAELTMRQLLISAGDARFGFGGRESREGRQNLEDMIEDSNGGAQTIWVR
jgi:hypothetical protein